MICLHKMSRRECVNGVRCRQQSSDPLPRAVSPSIRKGKRRGTRFVSFSLRRPTDAGSGSHFHVRWVAVNKKKWMLLSDRGADVVSKIAALRVLLVERWSAKHWVAVEQPQSQRVPRSLLQMSVAACFILFLFWKTQTRQILLKAFAQKSPAS
jgi:hypothetical protein